MKGNPVLNNSTPSKGRTLVTIELLLLFNIELFQLARVNRSTYSVDLSYVQLFQHVTWGLLTGRNSEAIRWICSRHGWRYFLTFLEWHYFCRFRRIAVVINSRPTKLAFEVDALKHLPLTLHPVQVLPCFFSQNSHKRLGIVLLQLLLFSFVTLKEYFHVDKTGSPG